MLLHSVMALATCVATVAEKRRPLPVDAMIPDPIFTSTHAITIDAPPEQVWPWIAQMGAGRAGWYSWDAIDNGGRPSSTGIMPALQTVVAGDIMPAVPGAKDAFVVAAADPPRDLVLTVPDGRGGHAVAWEHHLEPLDSGHTRLVVRGRASSHWLDLARAKPGLWERINISVFLLWIVVLATVLLRGEAQRPRPPGEMQWEAVKIARAHCRNFVRMIAAAWCTACAVGTW